MKDTELEEAQRIESKRTNRSNPDRLNQNPFDTERARFEDPSVRNTKLDTQLNDAEKTSAASTGFIVLLVALLLIGIISYNYSTETVPPATNATAPVNTVTPNSNPNAVTPTQMNNAAPASSTTVAPAANSTVAPVTNSTAPTTTPNS